MNIIALANAGLEQLLSDSWSLGDSPYVTSPILFRMRSNQYV